MKTISMSYDEYNSEIETAKSNNFHDGFEEGGKNSVSWLASMTVEDVDDMLLQETLAERRPDLLKLLSIIKKGLSV